jgi:hypothetical protein
LVLDCEQPLNNAAHSEILAEKTTLKSFPFGKLAMDSFPSNFYGLVNNPFCPCEY